MNVRPTHRAPPPNGNGSPAVREHDVEDAHFTEAPPVERTNNLPAERQQQSNALPSEGPVQQPSLPVTPFAKLASAIAGVMAEIRPVEKTGWNDFHKYNYAKMGDLSIELTPLMGRHGIVIFQNEVDRAMFDEGKVISVRYQFTVVHSSGEIWPERPLITGMSRCRDKNGGFDDKSFNKAHTAARKYFLLSLFQIPTDDEQTDDPDTDGATGNRPSGPARRAPGPDGVVGPHLIPIVNGEAPQDWADRFIKAIGTAKEVTDVNKWYDANIKNFDKLKKFDGAMYDQLIDAMDAREAAILNPAPAKEDTISSGPPKRAPRQRAPTPTKTLPPPAETFDVAEWLASLDNAFSSCEATTQLIEEQNKHMIPQKGKVSDDDWQKAVELVRLALKRIEAAGD